MSDSPNKIDAMNRGGHMDMRTTERVYRRKPTEIIALPRVPKKAGKPLPEETKNFQTRQDAKLLIIGRGGEI